MCNNSYAHGGTTKKDDWDRLVDAYRERWDDVIDICCSGFTPSVETVERLHDLPAGYIADWAQRGGRGGHYARKILRTVDRALMAYAGHLRVALMCADQVRERLDTQLDWGDAPTLEAAVKAKSRAVARDASAALTAASYCD